MAVVEGIDVSKWQPELDWLLVARGGIWFAFIKASEGMWEDPKFDRHWRESRGLVLRGAYHFFRPSVDPVQQAETFYNTVAATGDLGELPPVLDVERRRTTWDRVAACMDEIERRFGRTPILYTSPGFARLLGQPPRTWPLWIAHYTDSPEPSLPEGWDTWTFWQYTSKGRVPGYPRNIDRNRFNGSLKDLFSFAGMNQAEMVWWRLNRLEYLVSGVPVEGEPGPTPPIEQGVPYRVTVASLRIRKGPGVDYPVVGGLRWGDIVYVYEVVNEGEYAPWGRIGEDRWISLQFAERLNSNGYSWTSFLGEVARFLEDLGSSS